MGAVITIAVSSPRLLNIQTSLSQTVPICGYHNDITLPLNSMVDARKKGFRKTNNEHPSSAAETNQDLRGSKKL